MRMRTLACLFLVLGVLACRGKAGDPCSGDQDCGDKLRCEAGVCTSIYGDPARSCEDHCRTYVQLREAVVLRGQEAPTKAQLDEALGACLARCGGGGAPKE